MKTHDKISKSIATSLDKDNITELPGRKKFMENSSGEPVIRQITLDTFKNTAIILRASGFGLRASGCNTARTTRA
jgi:hypothetical protein